MLVYGDRHSAAGHCSVSRVTDHPPSRPVLWVTRSFFRVVWSHSPSCRSRWCLCQQSAGISRILRAFATVRVPRNPRCLTALPFRPTTLSCLSSRLRTAPFVSASRGGRRYDLRAPSTITMHQHNPGHGSWSWPHLRTSLRVISSSGTFPQSRRHRDMPSGPFALQLTAAAGLQN